MAHWLHRGKRTIDGKTVEDPYYSVRYRLDWMSKARSKSLKTANPKLAQRNADEFVEYLTLKHANMPIPFGLFGAPSRDTVEIVDDYMAHLRAKQVTEQHQRDKNTHLSRLVKECGWKTIDLITADSLDRWIRKEPQKLKSKKPQVLSNKTINEYISTIKAMMNWLKKMGKIEKSPLEQFDKLPTDGFEQKVRRPWTDEEIRTLVNTRPFYWLSLLIAARTGYRRNEIQTMAWADVLLDTENPLILPRKKNTKNKKAQPIPLTAELAELMRGERPRNWKPEDPVLTYKIPKAEYIAKDLKKLGIEYKDALGRDIDFYSLRYTFSTDLAITGASQRMQQSLCRHASAHLTANIYTDASQLDTQGTVAKLPPILSEDRNTRIRTRGTGESANPIRSQEPWALESQSTQDLINHLLNRLEEDYIEDALTSKMVVGTGFEPV